MRSILTLFLFIVLILGCKRTSVIQNEILYIGTMTSDMNDGIKIANLDLHTGTLNNLQTAAKLNSPNFLDIDSKQHILYSVGEKYKDSTTTYFVNMFQINKTGDRLHFITEEKVIGIHPCYISYSPKHKKLMTANYFSGNNSFFSVSDNKIKLTNTYQHHGIGPDTIRQEMSHAHSIKIGPNEKYAYSADLGADKIYIFDLDDKNNSVVDSIICTPGCGPRHIEFSPDKKIMTVVNELNSTINVFTPGDNQIYNKLTQTISALPDTFSGESYSADIHFSKDGKNLYASNRGYNSLVIYKIKDGILKTIGWETKGINWPRNFAIDPSDKYILIANQKGNDITIYKRDQENGLLKKLDYSLNVNAPVCIKFLHD